MRRRRVRIPAWLIITVALLGAIFGGASFFYFSKILNSTHTSIGQIISPPFEGQKLFRVLVIGEDETAKGRGSGRGLSDTIMVVAVDLDKKTVRALSIPRDSRVEIPGHGDQKINAAYVFGGPELTRSVAQTLLGVDIDYHVKTNIAGLKDIVDQVGGVGIDIEKDMFYTDRHGGLYIRLKKGYRHLSGEKALQYVRFRHDKLGDITRMQRQQKFLRALARELTSPKNFAKLPGILGSVYDNHWVETNMSAKDLTAMASLARDVKPEDMETGIVPGTPERIGGVSYWVPDTVKLRIEVSKLLYFTDPAGTRVKVEVLNGSGVPGNAQAVAGKLTELGYTITSMGNAASFKYDCSEIIVRKGALDGIEKMAQCMNCTRITEDASRAAKAADVTVIVGKDFRSQ